MSTLNKVITDIMEKNFKTYLEESQDETIVEPVEKSLPIEEGCKSKTGTIGTASALGAGLGAMRLRKTLKN